MAISSQQNNGHNPLFTRSKPHPLSFLTTILLSLILMFADYHYQLMDDIRADCLLIISPLQYMVDYPVRLFTRLQSLVSAKTHLVNENIELRYKQTLLEAQLQRLMAIKQENSALKELLLVSANTQEKGMAAHILAVDTTIARQLIIVNKGKRDGVYKGQPVLDAKGVVGQVIDVGYMTSTVLLISDAKSAVPVRNNRTGERAILTGLNHASQLALINLPKTADIKINDLLVTSGLGQVYPEGYPVGRVTHIKNMPGEVFIQVDVTPNARLNRNRLVLLIWPGKEQQALIAQINERIQAIGT